MDKFVARSLETSQTTKFMRGAIRASGLINASFAIALFRLVETSGSISGDILKINHTFVISVEMSITVWESSNNTVERYMISSWGLANLAARESFPASTKRKISKIR